MIRFPVFSPPGVVALFLVLCFSGCSKEARLEQHLSRARAFQAEGQIDKARIEYMNALRIDGAHPEALEQVGRIWLDDGVALRAAPYLAKVADLDPDNLEVRKKLATIYLAFGDFGAARTEALSILEKEPSDLEAGMLLVDTSMSPEMLAESREKLGAALEQDTARAAFVRSAFAAREGRVDEAITQLDQALARDETFEEAHLAKASLLLARKELEPARAELEKATKTAKPRSKARLRLAEHKMQTGDREGAVADLEEMLAEAPSFTAGRILLARILLSERDYDGAKSQLKEVFSRDASNIDGRMLESEVLVFEGNSEKAVETLKSLREEYPQLPGIHFHLGRAYLLTANRSMARASLEEALRLNPGYIEAHLMLAELNLQEGQHEQVAAAMSALLERIPNLYRAQTLLAESYRRMGRFEDAAKILREQMAVAPDNTEPVLLLAVVLRQLGQADEAEDLITRAMEIDPGNLLGLSQAVEMDVQRDDIPGAIVRIEAFRAAGHDSAATHLLEGRVRLAGKDWPAAEAALQKALEMDPDLTNAYELLISGYMEGGDLQQAVGRIEDFLGRSPQNVPARQLLAMIREQLGQKDLAIEAYKLALEADPNSTTALNNLAWLYAEEDSELDLALEYASRARGLRPGEPFIADTLGWIHYKRGEYRDAERLLAESAESAPDQPEILYHLAMARYMMGDQQAATGTLEKALAMKEGNFPSRADAEAALAEWSGDANGGSVEEIQALVERRGEDPLLLLRLGDAHAAAGDRKAAADVYRRALSVNPSLNDAALGLARIEWEEGRLDAAMKVLQTARDRGGRDVRVTALLGRVALGQGNDQWAYSLLQESRSALEDDPAALRDYAAAAFAIGRVEEAVAVMTTVAESPDADETVKTGAAQFVRLASATDPASAVPLADEAGAVEDDSPNRLVAQNVLALAREASGNAADAAAEFEAILETHPDFAPASRELAAIYLGDEATRGKAYELAMRARKALPEDPRLARVLAEISHHRGEDAFAIQLFDESARSAPLDAEGLYFAGMSRMRSGDTEEGRAFLARSLEAGLRPALEAQAKATLEPQTDEQAENP